MAVLSDAGRQALRNYWMRRFGASLTKADLRAAIDATDNWIDANQSSFNTALPEPAKSVMSLGDKSILFSMVALRRAGFGEVI